MESFIAQGRRKGWKL